jgi:hypothetical protein
MVWPPSVRKSCFSCKHRTELSDTKYLDLACAHPHLKYPQSCLTLRHYAHLCGLDASWYEPRGK